MPKPLGTIQKIKDYIQEYKDDTKQMRVKFIQYRLDEFDHIGSIDQETKDKIRPYIKERMAEAFDGHNVIRDIAPLYLFFFLAFVILCILLVFIIFLFINYKISLYVIMFALIIFIIALLNFRTLKYWYLNSFYQHDAYAFILWYLIELLYFSQTQVTLDFQRYWGQKRTQMERIELISNLIEQYLPLQIIHEVTFSGGVNTSKTNRISLEISVIDNATEAWLKETMKQVAAAVREKKKWLLLPKEDTREYFVKSMTSLFMTLINGNLDSLERIEPVKLTPIRLRHIITKFLLSALRTIAISALPIVAFFVLQKTSFALTGAAYNTALTILVIYELTVVASILDPNFSNRITNIKDISGLWRDPGRGDKGGMSK